MVVVVVVIVMIVTVRMADAVEVSVRVPVIGRRAFFGLRHDRLGPIPFRFEPVEESSNCSEHACLQHRFGA